MKLSNPFVYGGIAIVILAFILPYILGLTFNKSHPATSTSLPSLLNHMDKKQVNWEKNENSFSDGVYYEFTGEETSEEASSSRRIEYPEVILGYLSGNGVDIQEAWFKSYSSSCSPPGSNQAMDVIVPAKLIIRVASPISENEARQMGVTRRSSPSMGTCAYQVRHYTFFSKK